MIAVGAAIESVLQTLVNNIIVEIGFNNSYYCQLLFNTFIISYTGGSVFSYSLNFEGSILKGIEDLVFSDLVGINFI